MEKIKFDFSKCKDDYEKANALMEFIVNRAAMFDKKKYDTIVMNLSNDNCGRITWELCQIIHLFYPVKMIIPMRTIFYDFCPIKNTVMRRRPQFWINHLKKKENVLSWDTDSTWDFSADSPDAKIFDGISSQEIDFIVKILYNKESMEEGEETND